MSVKSHREFDASLFVSREEAQLFKQSAPESAHKTGYFSNGVDTGYFSPEREYPNPYPQGEQALVFTGAMDYWPNVDAVRWFAEEIFPAIHAALPQTRFYIVGSRPTAGVRELARLPGITVTGTVADVRPYLAHARIAVAPLRMARGLQNKVLEAMAMAKTVLASPQAAEGIQATQGNELHVAANAEEFGRKILTLLAEKTYDQMGKAARARILADYDWDSCLAQVDALLTETPEFRASHVINLTTTLREIHP